MTVDIGKLNEEQNKLKDTITEYDNWKKDKSIEDRKQSIQNEIDAEEEKLRIFKEGKDGNGSFGCYWWYTLPDGLYGI